MAESQQDNKENICKKRKVSLSLRRKEKDSGLEGEHLEQKKDDIEPPCKKRRASLSERFDHVNDSAVEVASKGVVPLNTSRNNQWALNNFTEWEKSRESSSEPVPKDLLSSSDDQLICKWLCRFTLETRQENGEPYPPKTIYLLLCGLYRVCKANGLPFNFLDKADSRFRDLHCTLDSLFSTLHVQGIGAEKKSAPVITIEDEDLMWEKGVLSSSTPRSLQYAVFFYVGIHFSLRGGQEQRNLTVAQVRRNPLDVTLYDANTYYEYVEFISKNNQHRFKDIHGKNKVVKAFAVPGSNKCIVKLLDLYLARLPAEPKAFYLRPRNDVPQDGKPWYINVPVGVNTLQAILPKISEEAGTSVRYTNHSLRATCATRLFANNIQEKIIQEKTGHRSLSGLRSYEKVTVDQERNAARVLNAVTSEEENKVCKVEGSGAKDVSDSLASNSTVISGQMENCVLNIYLK